VEAHAVADQGLFEGQEPNEDRVNEILQRITEGEDAKRELAILKPTLAYALSKLPKKQLRVRAEEMETLADTFTMQAKSDGQGGIILRSVKVL
jgi:hypothetical protein